ncbi:MAB_1171c family putative transporter [Catenuloplanes japonicus]|uniref:MAB_1171c family putative transporter n=1 Tax=Catenuloplanes japonicus TaxID=33876 RepID=UPI002FC27D3F
MAGRRGLDRGLVGMCIAMAGLAMTFTLSTPVVWLQVDRFIHVPNIATLVSQAFVLIYTAGQEIMLLYWLYPLEKARRHVRVRVIVLVSIIPIMTTLFLIAGTEGRRVDDFVAHYAGIPAVSLYLSIYLIGFAAGQIDVLRLAIEYAPICSDKALRRGLRTVSAGAALGIVYVLARAADIAAGTFGWNPYAWELAAQLSAGIGAILVVIGLNLPGWAVAATLWRRYLQLRPLRTLVRQSAADGARSRPAAGFWWDISFLLHWRVTEIRDQILLLNNWAPTPDTIGKAGTATADLPGSDPRGLARLEAVRLATAVALRRAGKPPRPVAEADGDETPTGGDDVLTDAAWLADVARELRSPSVKRAVTQLTVVA